MKNIGLISLICVVLSCHKETERDIALAEIRQMQFTCSGVQDTLYFSGKINNSPYCLSDGVQDVYALSELGANLITTTGYLNTSDTNAIHERFLRFSYIVSHYNKEYNRATILKRPDIDITGPIINRNVTLLEHCERYLKKGTYKM